MPSVTLQPNQVMVRVTDQDIIKMSNIFKCHRDYIAVLFKEKGYEVTEWHTRTLENGGTVQGLQYYAGDSVIEHAIEVVGTKGVNIRPILAVIV